MIRLRFALLAAALASGQSVESPRPQPSDYPAHAGLKELSLGADFLVHTFSGSGETFVVQDYLVLEVAVYPAPGARPMVAHSHFTLKINGKQPILPQPPPFVAASLKYPDWSRKPQLTTQAGVGDAAVILGRRQQVPRFPGDNRPDRERLPGPPRAPGPENRSGIEKEEVRPELVCVEQALPEGPAAGPIRGYVYYPYRGKAKDIKKLELLYAGPEDAAAALKLR